MPKVQPTPPVGKRNRLVEPEDLTEEDILNYRNRLLG